MGVKLLSLPRVVFAQVLREMQLFEVFELSQVSKNMYTRIKRVRRKLKPITVSHGYSRSEISATESPGCNFDLNFRFEQRMDSVVIRKLNIRDLKIEVSEKIETRKTFLCFEDQFLTVMIPLLKHLMDLFNMKYTTLLVNYDRISEDFFHPVFHKCVELNTFSLSGVPDQCLYRLMESKPMLKALNIGDLFEYRFKLPLTARTIPRILIEFAYSVCPVFVMNQEMITILHHDYEVESLNWLLKFWLSERNTKFQKLTLGCFWTPPNFDVLLKGVKYMEWDEKRRPRYYEYQETYFPIKIDCKDGFDLRRDDGVLATIAHDKERKMLHFIVWNQRQ
ncbi:hypothetical protein L5515_002104 [Caenorhabditis briggsae]|uniref:F-box domain-containing protein n=1 Tax=Caenorhabditis briggsae TaxID=6238 RepID=A0AAE9J4F9_CAEBR|nr:hypothetical protein L5515_002104 [Caenorhabditis briggsae]